MLGNQILVSYDAHASTNVVTYVALRINNSFGMVTNVKACYNRRGEVPGAEKSCNLQYVAEQSDDEFSTFVGAVSFDTAGYRTFYIDLYVNGQNKFIEYDNEAEEAVLTDTHRMAFWQVYVHYSDFKTPDWVKGGIMYQIFVDTFCSKDLPEHLKSKVVTWNTFPKWKPDEDGEYRNDQYYGGNLKGIISKLDYLKTLNVSIIYLTPILQSSTSNRYDIDNYEEVDEMVGTWSDLDELHKKANALGMKLVVDMVFNHSGSNNKLILEEPELYEWIDYDRRVAKCWWGYKPLVEFNKRSKGYFSCLIKWLNIYRLYMDGIRLDVADNLPDNVLKFLRDYWNLYILGEVWKNAVLGDGRDFLIGDKLDGVMNYQSAIAIYRYLIWGNYRNFNQIMKELELYPSQALDVSPIFLSSHDTPRIESILSKDFMQNSSDFETVWDMERNSYWYEDGKFNTLKFRTWEFENDALSSEKRTLTRRLKKLAVFLQYTLPGLPSVFAGEEAGVIGYKDPFNRKPFPWDNIDEDMYQYYCSIGEFRKKYSEVFADSTNFKLLNSDERCLVYKRADITCFVNRTDSEIRFDNPFIHTLFKVYDFQEDFVLPPFNAVAI